MMSVPDENLREVGFHRFWCAERSCQLLWKNQKRQCPVFRLLKII